MCVIKSMIIKKFFADLSDVIFNLFLVARDQSREWNLTIQCYAITVLEHHYFHSIWIFLVTQ